MERVREYKYVGVMVDEEGDWKCASRRVIDKGQARVLEMNRWLLRHWEISVKVKVHVWRAIVGSILRYGSEVWFPLVQEEIRLEEVQLEMLRRVMRLTAGTTAAFMRGETGLFEVRRYRDKAMC